jgi:hypothetical protein
MPKNRSLALLLVVCLTLVVFSGCKTAPEMRTVTPGGIATPTGQAAVTAGSPALTSTAGALVQPSVTAVNGLTFPKPSNTNACIIQPIVDSITSTASTDSPQTAPIITTSSDFPVMSRFEISSTPRRGQNIEIFFSLEIKSLSTGWPFMNQTPDSLLNANAWVSVFKADIDGSFSKARRLTAVPEAVVSGNTSWEGNAQETRYIELKSTIRLPGDGIWFITGDFTGNHKNAAMIEYSKYFAIVDGITLDYRSEEIKSSSLAYLKNFSYGWSDLLPNTEENPLRLEMDMEHPPLAGEEVTLTFLASSSFFDIRELTVGTDFGKRNANGGILVMPANVIVVKSELGYSQDIFDNTLWEKWQIDLTKGKTRTLLTTIKFPYPGEWQITIRGKGDLPNGKRVIANDEINLTITDNQAYYGWKNQ